MRFVNVIGVHQRLSILVTGPEVFDDLIDCRGYFGCTVDCAVAHLGCCLAFRLPRLRAETDEDKGSSVDGSESFT